MAEHTIVESFTPLWWISTFVALLVLWLSLRYLSTLPWSKLRKVEIGLVWFVILRELAWQIYYIYVGSWDIRYCLPLQLCGISQIVGAILLVRFHQGWYEFLLLLGLGGAVQSFLTPEITTIYNWLTHIDFYVAHGLIWFFALYQLVVKKRTIRPNAWLTAFLIGLGTLGVMAIFNKIIDGNYIFLCQRPIVENPLIMGDWPYYLLSFLGFGLTNIVLFHFFFRWQGKRISPDFKAS